VANAKAKLTKSFVDRIEPPADGKIIVWDIRHIKVAGIELWRPSHLGYRRSSLVCLIWKQVFFGNGTSSGKSAPHLKSLKKVRKTDGLRPKKKSRNSYA
jgi:hypothetical protein